MRLLSKKALLFCQVFIGFPLKYAPESSGVTGLIFSPAVFWWGLTVGLLQLGFMCHELYMISVGSFSTLFPERESSIAVLAEFLINGSILSMGLVLFTNYVMKYPTFLEVCNVLEKFDHNLQLGIPEYCSTINVPTIVLCLVIRLVLKGVNLCLKRGPELIVREIIACICMEIVQCGRIGLLIQFQQVARGITERFRLVNDRIRLQVLTQSFTRSFLRQHPLIQDWMSCRKVVSLMNCYHLLCDAVHQANVFYGDLLLASMSCTFIEITETLYMFSVCIAKEDALTICGVAACVLSQASFLVLITLSSSGVSEVTRETAPLVRKLISQELDSELREELKSFLLQLDSKTVEFSASGFFQLNRKTLTSMTAAVTTYLVIMIQFGTQSN
ncbi:gustatory receptor [Homalodisca vitripennis]|nr:gustatory receptor [Homalodisca vitripennis]